VVFSDPVGWVSTIFGGLVCWFPVVRRFVGYDRLGGRVRFRRFCAILASLRQFFGGLWLLFNVNSCLWGTGAVGFVQRDPPVSVDSKIAVRL
jgi:hypothetical protein